MAGGGPTSWMTRPLVSMTNGSTLKFALPLAPSNWVHLLDGRLSQRKKWQNCIWARGVPCDFNRKRSRYQQEL